jgi:predicted ABC-type ATPase
VDRERPSVVVLAGPNGAGKSTMAARLLVGVLRVSEFVDADVLLVVCRVQRQPPSPPAVLCFAVSMNWPQGIAGYECHLVFLWLPSADFAVARVADRVRLGGHAVPEETVRRCYRSGLRNFFRLYEALTTTWRMYDNSIDVPRLVASGAGTETLTVNGADLWQRIRAEAGYEA